MLNHRLESVPTNLGNRVSIILKYLLNLGRYLRGDCIVPRPILRGGNIQDVFAPSRLGDFGIFRVLWSLYVRGDQSKKICHNPRYSSTESISLYKVVKNIRGVLTEVTKPGQTRSVLWVEPPT